MGKINYSVEHWMGHIEEVIILLGFWSLCRTRLDPQLHLQHNQDCDMNPFIR